MGVVGRGGGGGGCDKDRWMDGRMDDAYVGK